MSSWILRLLQPFVGGAGTEPSLVRTMEAAQVHANRTIMRTITFGLDRRNAQLEIVEHSALVATLCRSLGREAKISEADAFILETAAELHEVGMFAVSPALLMRSGPLTLEELGSVRAQATVSAELAAYMHHPRVALLIEHQYSDFASGIPLANSDLLLAGILRVADTIAAVTRPRPYQDPMPIDERALLLITGSGQQYHPVAVDSALQLVQLSKMAEVPVRAA